MSLPRIILYNECVRDAIGSIEESADTAINGPNSDRNGTDGVVNRRRLLFQKLK